ncbi:MAG: hypothetical protein WAL63_10780 [Solirubrobacteraceae bacterium]
MRILSVVVVTLGVTAVLVATDLTAPGAGDVQSQISEARSAVATLRSAIAVDSAHIQATTIGLDQARGQLDTLQAELSARETQLHILRAGLLAARRHLHELEARLRLAVSALAANLVARYESPPSDIATVVLDSRGFTNLLEGMRFLSRIGDQDADVAKTVRVARGRVAAQAVALAALEQRARRVVDEVLGRRDQVAALKVALARRQIAQMSARATQAQNLHGLERHLDSLQARAAAQARREAASFTAGAASVGGVATALPSPQSLVGGAVAPAHINPDGTATAPADAPPAVKAVIAAANQIIDKPYIYAGGHASWIAAGYDCSGAVSYALHGGGLLSAPLAVQFEQYGDPGPGRWITVYADSQHVFAAIAGLAFDTSDYGGPNIPAGSGPRWRSDPTGNFADGGDFVARHPPGL